MQLDELPRREGQLGRLDSAIARVAEGPRPLLADHLHLEGGLRAVRHGQRIGSLAAARSLRAAEQLIGAEPASAMTITAVVTTQASWRFAFPFSGGPSCSTSPRWRKDATM